MNGLEVRHLRYFVAVAEELNFSRAAGRLRVAQPSLSRAIIGLERIVGARLFERSTRQVSLTAAGEALLVDARLALDAVQAAGHRAARTGRGRPTLAVAAKPDGDAGLLAPVLAAVQREIPDLDIGLVFASTGGEAAAMLRDGRADVALVPAPFDDRGLDCQDVHSEPRVAALPAAHPLAAGETVELADALAQPVVSWPGVDADLAAFYQGHDCYPGPDCYQGDDRYQGDDPAAPRRASRGARAPAGPPAADLAQALRLVELGRAITFLPVSVAARYRRPAIAYRPVPGLSHWRLRVAWAATSRSRLVAAFVHAATTAEPADTDSTSAPAPAPAPA
ncbi:MAG TPA: LysR substrate-binding domain-containing protein [Mycobacteriales bacterium]|nr:LysR substrate-binding domain-containing protein [Mycobacteriales bacterium]